MPIPVDPPPPPDPPKPELITCEKCRGTQYIEDEDKFLTEDEEYPFTYVDISYVCCWCGAVQILHPVKCKADVLERYPDQQVWQMAERIRRLRQCPLDLLPGIAAIILCGVGFWEASWRITLAGPLLWIVVRVYRLWKKRHTSS